jgi:hypothetical protein
LNPKKYRPPLIKFTQLITHLNFIIISIIFVINDFNYIITNITIIFQNLLYYDYNLPHFMKLYFNLVVFIEYFMDFANFVVIVVKIIIFNIIFSSDLNFLSIIKNRYLN